MSSPPTNTPIVQELVDYLSENPDFKDAFEQSFKEARKYEFKLWDEFNVHRVDDYLRYMNEFVYWVPCENTCGKDVYNHICLFYFILDLPPLRDYQSPIDPSSHSPWKWLSEWLIKYAKEMGKWMDKPGSITEKTLQTFVESPAYRDKGVSNFYDQYPWKEEWTSFNRFFARRINPNHRLIASPDDPTVIVCPADCAFSGQWNISESTGLCEPEVRFKGVPWSIRQLLDDGSHNFHPLFSGGIFTHAFLNTTNYHRLHAPVSGTIKQAKVIPGLCYLEVGVEDDKSPYSAGPPKPRLTMRRQMMPKDTVFSSVVGDGNGQKPPTAPNSPGYQFLQARALILIESKDLGLVAVLPIGMAQVSSVLLSVKEGEEVKKGQEIACFQLGGSDVVVVFQKAANVKLDWKNFKSQSCTDPKCDPCEEPEEGECPKACKCECCAEKCICECFTKYGSQIGTAELGVSN